VGDREALLRVIIENPEPDAPRRDYARWARSVGDDYGDFIELQLALTAKHRAHESALAWGPLWDRSEAMLEEARALWLKPFRDVLDSAVLREPRFMRGFIEYGVFDARAFVLHAAEMYERAPILHVKLDAVVEYPQILESPFLARLVSLDMTYQGIGDEHIQRLAESPYAARLRWLSIALNQVTQCGLEALCASPYLKHLQYLECGGNRFEDPTDTFGSEGEAIVFSMPTEAGTALEARHGRLEWLHAPDHFDVGFPPSFLAVEPS